jgi:hypothetical protein
VAILSSESFDARLVALETVDIHGAGEMHIDHRTGQPLRHLEDTNQDGRVDLLIHVRFGDTTLTCSSVSVVFTAETQTGQPISGSDAIFMVGNR